MRSRAGGAAARRKELTEDSRRCRTGRSSRVLELLEGGRRNGAGTGEDSGSSGS